MTLLGIGNVLEKDDGFGVYASTYIKENYTFSKDVNIIDGGVEGINLVPIFEGDDNILVLDTIDINDTPNSIYLIPSDELRERGINSGGAHEIGVLQCIDIIELLGNPVPEINILGVVPQEISFDIGLTPTLKSIFSNYINIVLGILKDSGIEATERDKTISLEEIINDVWIL